MTTRYETRIDFGHGANKYLFMRGNTHSFDAWTLEQILDNHFIDVKNQQYDMDVSKEFTWDF